jgi:monothiol glutaredoxin
MREGIKQFSNWPTIPQLYVDGTFVGGCDIVRDMYQSGELQDLLGAKKDTSPVKPPSITVTPAAAKAFKAAQTGGNEHPRIEISSDYQYELLLDEKKDDDIVVDAGNGLTVLFDKASARRADGMHIDFVESPGAFKIDNPNEPPRVKPLAPKDLRDMLDRGEKVELFDVRPPAERARASLKEATPLDERGIARLESLPKDTPIVFHCHHGGRSRQAAEQMLGRGFTNVFNLEGGIDAWSTTVDSSVPRY